MKESYERLKAESFLKFLKQTLKSLLQWRTNKMIKVYVQSYVRTKLWKHKVTWLEVRSDLIVKFVLELK